MLVFDEGALIWWLSSTLEIKFLNSRKSRRLILSHLLRHTPVRIQGFRFYSSKNSGRFLRIEIHLMTVNILFIRCLLRLYRRVLIPLTGLKYMCNICWEESLLVVHSVEYRLQWFLNWCLFELIRGIFSLKYPRKAVFLLLLLSWRGEQHVRIHQM